MGNIVIVHNEQHSFPWGEVIKIHTIGEFDIVEFTWKTSIDPKNSLSFACFVNGEDCNQSFNDLDTALAFCIAYKHDGINTIAHKYFMRGIGAYREQHE